jgi:hypothetical protein
MESTEWFGVGSSRKELVVEENRVNCAGQLHKGKLGADKEDSFCQVYKVFRAMKAGNCAMNQYLHTSLQDSKYRLLSLLLLQKQGKANKLWNSEQLF